MNNKYIIYLFLIVIVQDTFESENTRYNCSSAVTCLLYATLQTANEPSGSINRSPNGSIKARYDTLSCMAYYGRDLGSGLPCGG